jgi:hypothetical protein
MRKLCCIFIIVIAVAIACCSVAAAESKKAMNNEENKIISQFPGYHILSLKDLYPETRGYFSRDYPNEKPGIVKSDFNGDGYQDYAVLLKKNNAQKTKLVILFCSAVSPCNKIDEVDVGYSYAIVYLRLVKSGTVIEETDAADTENPSSPMRLKHAGVELTYSGQAKIVYYWNEKLKKIETMQTAD